MKTSDTPATVLKSRQSALLACVFFLQMYLVIFPEGTRYNPELKNVITDSQAFAAKEGTGTAAVCCSYAAY